MNAAFMPWEVKMVVSLTNHGAVAIATIDNPPVNATSAAVRQRLADIFDLTEADEAVKAVVLTCAGRTFIAGADIKEFNAPPIDPILPDLLTKLENATKPWVAAIHGSALGGGLETALICRYRIASPDAKLGLPEVTLGLIPGAGGTVRLPRLVSPINALDMIASGKPISAQKALEIGLIDEIAHEDLLEQAIRLAERVAIEPLTLSTSKRALVELGNASEFETKAKTIETKAGQQLAPKAAVQAVRNAWQMPVEEAFKAERDLFLQLKEGPQSAALRHVFFAERATSNIADLKGVPSRELTHIGIIGGGIMGAGIAAASLLAGFAVTMIERDDGAVEAGRGRVEHILAGSLKRGLISEAKHQALLASFDASSDYSDLSEADLVIEAVFEDMDVKKQVFAKLTEATRPETILASNTSYLDIAEIATAVSHPERVIGLHFFSPAHIMKLLEIIRPKGASKEALSTAFAFAKRLRKIPVLTGVCDGFIANRIMSAYRREAEYMLEDGAMPWQIDEAMRAFGMPIGLFEMQDMAGLEISWATRKRQAATRDPNQRYVDIGDKLCEAGHFGKKSGRGYYEYDEMGKPSPSAETQALIMAESERKGITRVAMSSDDIMDRIVKAMQKEAHAILSEGIARSGDDIDIVMINAFGFPRWKGGPLFMEKANL